MTWKNVRQKKFKGKKRRGMQEKSEKMSSKKATAFTEMTDHKVAERKTRNNRKDCELFNRTL